MDNVAILAIIGFLLIFLVLIFMLFASRRRQARLLGDSTPATAAAAGLATTKTLFEQATGHRAPVAAFHVRGEEIQVTFDVPLPDQPDQVLNDLLVSEAIEVAREKRHSLPIGDVTAVVAFAGEGDSPREVGRTQLSSPGELPPSVDVGGLTLANVAHDPFAAGFEDEGSGISEVQVRADTPGDELGPLAGELSLPESLERGLRAAGVDPQAADAGELILALLRMFGYGVTEHAQPNSYMTVKDGVSTYVQTEGHTSGESLEVSESSIRRFLADFNASGADRGILLTEKYAPFEIHEIETRQPKVRFITRERVQRFIDSMSLG